MKCLAILFFVGINACAALAQDSKAFTVCNNNRAETQAEMNACASAEAGRADEELNHVYAQVLAEAAGVTDAIPKVKTAERAWIGFRDAYIAASYPAKDKAAEYGSMYALDVELLRAKLTRQQITALKDLLKKYGG
jgi:uncharacterized protein YecT (DUF1311 family)